jgi:hypothetical protein
VPAAAVTNTRHRFSEEPLDRLVDLLYLNRLAGPLEPLHAGVRAVLVGDDERQVLLDVSRKLEHVLGGSFAKLQFELSIGE